MKCNIASGGDGMLAEMYKHEGKRSHDPTATSAGKYHLRKGV